MTREIPPPESLRKLVELIHDVRIAMLTTQEADGSLRSRPMATQKRDQDDPKDAFDGRLYFLSRASAPKTGEIEREHEVNVSFADPGKQIFVSVSGQARVSRDRARIEAMWNPIHKAWFPRGLDDPDIAVIEIEVTHAEFWDAPSNKMVQLIGLIGALATGTEHDPGDHARVNLERDRPR